jgi:hypothetical protein
LFLVVLFGRAVDFNMPKTKEEHSIDTSEGHLSREQRLNLLAEPNYRVIEEMRRKEAEQAPNFNHDGVSCLGHVYDGY